MFGSPTNLPVCMRWACCDLRLLRSDVIFCDGCSRSVISRQRVVVSIVLSPGMKVICDSESSRWRRDHRARSM